MYKTKDDPVRDIFRSLIAQLRCVRDDQRGVTALEYGLIGAVMVTAIASTIRGVSTPVTSAFCRTFEAISGLPITGICP